VEYSKNALGGRRAIQLCHGDLVNKSVECARKKLEYPEIIMKSGVYSEGLLSAISVIREFKNSPPI
jgi:hypothetical protein